MIEKLEEELKNEHEPKTITAVRGRLITAINKELKRENLSEEERNALTEKKKLYIEEQKKHLNERYVSEFLKDKAILGSIFTTLPKGMEISINKIKNTIEELKDAKTNKEKVFGFIDMIKSIGQTALTPFIYAGKFAIRHWYAVLISLGILDLTDTSVFKNVAKFFGKDETNSMLLGFLDNVKKDPIVSATRNVEHKVTDKIGEAIADKIGNPLQGVADGINHAINPAAGILDSIKENIPGAEEAVSALTR